MGRKPLFVMSLAIFALATLWCGLAGSLESFVAARAVCGLGAGGAMTLGSILTSDLVPIEYVCLLVFGFLSPLLSLKLSFSLISMLLI